MLQKYRSVRDMAGIITQDEAYSFFEQIYGAREWTFPDKETPRVAKISRFTCKKRMYYIFFNISGVVHIAFRRMNQAANSIDYKEQAKAVISKQGNNFCLHDDNARIHTPRN